MFDQTIFYLKNLFLLSEYNEYAYNKKKANMFWESALATNQQLDSLVYGTISVDSVYNNLNKFNTKVSLFDINLTSTYFKNNRRLERDELIQVLSANAKTLRFESRKKTLLSFISPLLNLILVPIKLPMTFAIDLFLNLPIDLMFGAARLGSDYYDSYNSPRVEPEQTIDAENELSRDAQRSYCCKNPITVCFNKARAYLGYDIEEETPPGLYRDQERTTINRRATYE